MLSASVIISSSAEVVAIASVAGTGTTRFTGNYTGFDGGALTYYLPTFAFNFYGWYSMISVQNLGSLPADITVDISCSNVPLTGSLSVTDLASMASHTFPLKSVVPSGFAPTSQCVGSAVVTSDQPVVATDSQNKPASGNTNTFSGVAAGSEAGGMWIHRGVLGQAVCREDGLRTACSGAHQLVAAPRETDRELHELGSGDPRDR